MMTEVTFIISVKREVTVKISHVSETTTNKRHVGCELGNNVMNSSELEVCIFIVKIIRVRFGHYEKCKWLSQ